MTIFYSPCEGHTTQCFGIYGRTHRFMKHSAIFILTLHCGNDASQPVWPAHLLFLLGMKGRWSAANVAQLCTTIHLSPLILHTVIKSNLAAKYTSSYICMTWQNSLR